MDNVQMSRFWKRKEIFYFLLSSFLVLLHNTGYSFYEMNGVVVPGIIKVMTRFLTLSLPMLVTPAFMMFSGIIFFRNMNWDILAKKMKSRIASLLVPYLLWNLISIAYNWIMYQIPGISDNMVVRGQMGFDVKSIMESIFLFKSNGINWFLAYLMVFVLFSPVIFICLRKKYLSILLIAASYIFYAKGHLPTLHENAFMYYVIGAYIGYYFFDRVKEEKTSESNHHKTLLKYGGGGIACLVYFTIFGENGPFLLLDVGMTLLYIVSLWRMMEFIPQHKVDKIPWWMTISFFIYQTHYFIEPCLNKLVYLLLPHTVPYIFVNVLMAGVTIVIVILAAWVLRKFCRPLWNLLNGNRIRA